MFDVVAHIGESAFQKKLTHSTSHHLTKDEENCEVEGELFLVTRSPRSEIGEHFNHLSTPVIHFTTCLFLGRFRTSFNGFLLGKHKLAFNYTQTIECASNGTKSLSGYPVRTLSQVYAGQ